MCLVTWGPHPVGSVFRCGTGRRFSGVGLGLRCLGSVVLRV